MYLIRYTSEKSDIFSLRLKSNSTIKSFLIKHFLLDLITYKKH